jgi:hypothetical protein
MIEKIMAERKYLSKKTTHYPIRRLPLILLLISLLLLVGCSGSGDTTGNTSGGSKSSIRLPPAWTPTPISIPGTGTDLGTWQPCDDAPPSQLEVGNIAVVEGTTLKMRLRSEPGLQGTLAGEIDPADVLEVINGPACYDKMVWWEVKSRANGLTGWAAEGNSFNTWLMRVD